MKGILHHVVKGALNGVLVLTAGGGLVSIVETTATTSTAIAVDVDGCSAGAVYYENASDTAGEGTLVIGDNVCGSNGGFGTPAGNPALFAGGGMAFVGARDINQ